MQDQQLVDDVVRLSGGDLPGGVAKPRLDLFETKLGAKLPSLLRALLLRANGGESILARWHGPYVPDHLEGLTRDTLWEYLLSTVAASSGGKLDATLFVGKYLPLGDDYSGEIYLIDLRDRPGHRVLCSAANASTPEAYDEDAKTLAAFFESAVKAASAPPQTVSNEPIIAAPLPEDTATIAFVKAMFGTRKVEVEGLPVHVGTHPTELWFRTQGGLSSSFRFRFDVRKAPWRSVGYFHFSTKAGPVLVTCVDAELIATTYKNDFLANDVRLTISPQLLSESPLEFERCKPTLAGASLRIFESEYRELVEPKLGGARCLAVLLVKDGLVARIRLDLAALADAAHGEKAVELLLSFGYEWLEREDRGGAGNLS